MNKTILKFFAVTITIGIIFFSFFTTASAQNYQGSYSPWAIFSGSKVVPKSNAWNVAVGTSTPLTKFDVYGNIILSGLNRYLNFDYTVGFGGYGFRDNAGSLEFKNSGGSWAVFGSGAGEANTASSLGTGLNLFDTKFGADLRFNTILAGSGVTLSTTTNSNTIVISSTGGGGGSVFAWTPQTWGNSTSTTLGFTNGFISSASSTISSMLQATGGVTGNLTGNADTATILQTARTIAGVSFNGSANISLNNNAITNGAGYTTNTGTVTSVAQSVPTGFTISGSPLTTSGTLALAYGAGYSSAGLLTASTTEWSTAYGWGDHSLAGYLTSYSETDPIVKAITGIVKSNGTTISSAVSGTDYEVPITFSTGLTRSTNTVTVNTSQNIGTLSNLTTNGFVKTSGATGLLSVDTSTYLTGNQSITLSGDVSGSGTTAITTTIGALKVLGSMIANATIDLTTKVTGTLPMINTKFIAGRSLTLSTDTVDADAELFTKIATGVIENPTAVDDGLIQWKFPLPITITRISCSTDVGTVTIQLDERAEATPNTIGTDVMTSTLICDTNTQATTIFTNAGILADVPLNLDVDAVATTPGIVRIHIDYTFND